MDKLIGTMLDNRYEVLEVIGTGGMAIVYKAKCHRLNRYVALKVMKEEFAKDEEFRRRFFEESQAVAMLSHPNIVNVYDVSRSGDIEYIVMELIDGVTLKEYLSRRGPLSWKETTFFAVQIAKALEHAHSRGVIHRDIKPQNIMLLRDGTVKVADFGIAHYNSSQTDYSKGEAIGSVHYVSPEQARGSHIDNRSDIYSFGVVMYEMLTGRLPFEGNTPMDIAIQHMNSIPLPPSDYVSGIPQALEAITMKAMDPVPSRRYSTAGEMIADLERFKNDPTVKIEVERPAIMASVSDDIDATRKISNPGEIASRATPRYQPVDEDDDRDEEPARGKKRGGNPVLYAGIAILLFFIGAVVFVFKVIDPFGKTDVRLEVPMLEGESYEQVLEDADGLYSSFKIILDEEQYSENIDKGIIISQSPSAGKNAEEGTEIKVVVSLGPKTAALDDYRNMDGRSVSIVLTRLGLKPDLQYEFSDEVEEGLVIGTSPDKGTEVSSGDTILVRVSKGKEVKPVIVPGLKGKTAEEAAALIKAAGLTPGETSFIESPDGVPGQVIFQSLPAGSSVDENSTIDIHICKEPEKQPDPEPAKDVTIRYVIEIDDIEGEIQIMAAVDSKVGYSGTHTSDEGSIVVELTAEEGTHSVTVFQNGRLTKEENVTFK